MAGAIDILLIGHMTVDLVPGGRMLGGTVAYAAPTYAAFGHKVGILTSAAYNEPLLGQLLPFGEVSLRPAENSLTYENIYTDSGRTQYIRATANFLRYGDIPVGWTDAPYVHLGPLAAELDPREIAERFPDATIMLTLQGMMRDWRGDGQVRFRRWFDACALERIDIVVYSEEDLSHFPQFTDDARRVCKHLVVTQGRHGGAYYHDGGSMRYESLPVTPKDLTGAGDVYAASLLGALPRLDGDVAKAARVAGKLAAYSVTRSGLASAPTRAEIEREINRVS
ncbi:MAG: hypothetical protein F4X02_02740 [Chloroflexi bacterium]|nr:hypothetical protein [Chloroflexota bacterium]